MSIEISGLCFSFGENEVLKNLSLKVEHSECVYVLGPNGSGKTTLFRCLLGQLTPKSGEIKIFDKLIGEYSAAQLARRIAYIPQEHSVGFNYSVFETVLMGTCPRLSPFSSPTVNEEKAALGALERLGIAQHAHKGINQVSGGERQLALIARALTQNAKILIMDEPTANLDYGNQIRVQQQMRALSREGYLVLQSAHNPQHAMLFADRIAAISEGAVCALGKPDIVLTPELLEKLYRLKTSVRGGQILPETGV